MKGSIVAEFVDKFGTTRQLRRIGQRRIALAKNTDTVSHKLNRVAAKMIGAKIRDKRLAAGLTLEELCTRAGLVAAIPKSRMWEIENSIRREGVRTGTLFALAKALNCEVVDFIPTVAEVCELAGVAITQTVHTGLK